MILNKWIYIGVVIGSLLGASITAKAYDSVVWEECVYKPYCGQYGQLQVCSYPRPRLYCERHFASGLIQWWWN